MSGAIEPSKHGVIILSGYRIAVKVDNGMLLLSDGIGNERREGRFSRAQRDFNRLIIVGHSGYITLEAVKWLNDTGIGFAQIDYDTSVLMSSFHYGRLNPVLRRAQSTAATTDRGLEILRYILTIKIEGQTENIAIYNPDISADIHKLREALPDTDNIRDILILESSAATAYWPVLAPLSFPFTKADRKKVPEHWLTIGSRLSPLTKAPRKAITPFHAILNYLYALLETETSIALQTMGLDPAIGIAHTDYHARDALACDVMEAVRPEVDRWLLERLKQQPFTARDFHETTEGQCRILPPLTKQLSDTLPLWRAAIAPVVEHIAELLARPSHPIATPLTGRKRREAWKERPAYNPKPCKQCGNPVSVKTRKFCSDECRSTFRREQLTRPFQDAGQRALQERRAQGQPSNTTPDAKAHAAETNRERHAANRDYDEAHPEPQDTAWYRAAVLPRLAPLPLSAIQKASGFSLRYCSLIRQGRAVPHPRAWSALAALVGVEPPDTTVQG